MNETLGKRIANHRKRMKLTQDQLAEKLNITAQAVSKWENDQSYPDITTLPKLAEIFQISIDELFGYANPKEAEVISNHILEEENENNGIHFQNGDLEIRYDNSQKGTIDFAILILSFGALYLIAHLFALDLKFWEILIPTSVLWLGGCTIKRKFSFFSISCIFLGGYFLISKFFQLNFMISWPIMIAILILLFGTSLLIDGLRKKSKSPFSVVHNNISEPNIYSPNYQCTGNTFSYHASFSSDETTVNLSCLDQGEIDVNFGDYVLDFSQIQSLSENATVQAKCSFGNLTILIPKYFHALVSYSTNFSAVETTGDPNPEPLGTITIIGSTNFGNTEIKYI